MISLLAYPYRAFIYFKDSKFLSKIRVAAYNAFKCSIHPSVHLGAGVRLYGARNIAIGAKTFLGPHCSIVAYKATVTIGEGVGVAAGTRFISRNHNFEDTSKPILEQGYSDAPIVVESNVWIGYNCTILPGVHIGTGAVIAAGSIVNKSIGPNEIWGGVPAKFIRNR